MHEMAILPWLSKGRTIFFKKKEFYFIFTSYLGVKKVKQKYKVTRFAYIVPR